jgi:hypothetical protein
VHPVAAIGKDSLTVSIYLPNGASQSRELREWSWGPETDRFTWAARQSISLLK